VIDIILNLVIGWNGHFVV